MRRLALRNALSGRGGRPEIQQVDVGRAPLSGGLRMVLQFPRQSTPSAASRCTEGKVFAVGSVDARVAGPRVMGELAQVVRDLLGSAGVWQAGGVLVDAPAQVEDVSVLDARVVDSFEEWWR